ncbi:hypothetical protein ACI2I2_01855 [Scandinavium sp. NPDC088450]|uniref:hypothetical protein n=1 Tax=Scandinavium sp. NPDC088450 TaxID=3364514 RepID=UPI00384FCD61
MDISKLVNFGVLTSFKDVFKENEDASFYLDSDFNYIDALLLSLMSFDEKEKDNVWMWSKMFFLSNVEALHHINNTKPFNRRGRLIAWKFLLANFNLSQNDNFDFDTRFLKIYKTLLAVNDRKNDSLNVEHEFINGFIFNYRDNYLSQCYRASLIFLEKIDHNVAERFYNSFGITLKDYCKVLHCVIVYYKNNFTMKCVPKVIVSNVFLDINKVCNFYHIDKAILDKVMDVISFDVEDGVAFSKENIQDDYAFSLFRDKPFIKMYDGCYLPVDGKLVEDLMFNNLFYKIKDLYCDGDVAFLNHFGEVFESYIQGITISEAMNSIINKYIVIPEFSYKYKKNILKSPDILIYNEKEKSLIVIEIKSSKYLGGVIESNNNIESIDASLEKIAIKPWEQAVKSLGRLREVKASEYVNDAEKVIFVAVSMNDFPMLWNKFEIKGEEGVNLTNAFFSMGMEAYENLVELLSLDVGFSLYQILIAYNGVKDKMSMKTYLARLKKKNMRNANPFREKVKYSTINTFF